MLRQQEELLDEEQQEVEAGFLVEPHPNWRGGGRDFGSQLVLGSV